MDERVNLLGLSLAKLSMLGSSNSSWTERETERKIIEGSSLHLWIPSRILARVKWTLNKWYARQSGRFFLSLETRDRNGWAEGKERNWG